MPLNLKYLSVSCIMSRMRVYLLVFIFPLIFSGCISRKSVPVRYYIIDYPAEVKLNINDITDPVNKSCLINPVQIYPAYSTNQIAVRENTHEIRYFTFNQWAVRPEQSFTTIIADMMNEHNIFKSVHKAPFQKETGYVIETTVYHLELTEEDRNHHAHLNIAFRLKDGRTNEELINHHADRKYLIEEKNLNLFASAISKIFLEELEVFTNSIITSLR